MHILTNAQKNKQKQQQQRSGVTQAIVSVYFMSSLVTSHVAWTIKFRNQKF